MADAASVGDLLETQTTANAGGACAFMEMEMTADAGSVGHGAYKRSLAEGLRVQQGLLKYRVRCGSCILCLLLIPLPLHAERPPMASIEATGSNVAASDILSPGRFLVQHLVNPWRRRVDALQSSTISLSRRPQVSRSFGPLRQITFLGGDRICAEIVRGDGEAIELRLRGGQTVAVPRDAISMIRVPLGEMELLNEPFETSAAPLAIDDHPGAQRLPGEDPRLDATLSASGRSSLRLNAESKPLVVDLSDLPESRIQFWFRVDPSGAANGDAEAAHIQFVFQPEASSRWLIDLTHSKAIIRGTGLGNDLATGPPVALGAGWHCLIAILDSDQSLCLVDDSLLFSTNGTPGSLRSLQFSSTADCWIDSLLVSKQTKESNLTVVQPSSQDDVVAGNDRIQWFGHVKQIDPLGVMLTAAGKDRLLPWRQVAAVTFRQPDRPVQERVPSPSGLVAEIEFQSLADRPEVPFDRLTATIVESNQEFVVAAHPWLGTMAIAWNAIARVRPKYYGGLLWLDGRQMHLGDAIEQGFHRPMPDGIEWSAEVVLPAGTTAHSRQFWLVMDVAELEPASPEAPPANRFLNELRGGQLLTELMINDLPAGHLNQWLRFRSQIDHPEQLRIPLSAGILHADCNKFRLKQIPLSKTGHYDNCEVSNLRLEIIEGTSLGQP